MEIVMEMMYLECLPKYLRRRAMSGVKNEVGFDAMIITAAGWWAHRGSGYYSTSAYLEHPTLGLFSSVKRWHFSFLTRSPAWVVELCPVFPPWDSSYNAPRDRSKSQTALLHQHHILVPCNTKKNDVYYLYVKLLFSQLKAKEELPTTPTPTPQ